MNENLFDIKKGTISFWVKENKINWDDDAITPLFEKSENGNSIFIVKDSDRKVKFFHVYFGKGRTDIEYDVSSLSPERPHFFAFTWSVGDREIKFYLDGEFKKKSLISY